MSFAITLTSGLLCLGLFISSELSPPRRFKHWVAGKEAGKMEVLFNENQVVTKNSLSIDRMGNVAEQKLDLVVFRDGSGAITADWALSLASQPHRGQARWSPAEPSLLRVSAVGRPDAALPLSPDVLLWPPDVDEKMRQAAKEMLPIRIAAFSFFSESASLLVLNPEASDPIGIFKDAVRYRGTISEGGSVLPITVWVSPAEGQVAQFSSQGGLMAVTQREEIKPPEACGSGGFFDWAILKLPQVPFLAWRDEIRVQGLPGLPETEQQKKIGPGEYLLTRAEPPNNEEARQPTLGNAAEAEAGDAPFLSDSALLGINDSAIDGLAKRLNIRGEASRWEAARLINSFVFEFIRAKGLDVGFASAPEVARNPRGDCTEHTVLAISLLRKLGIPARAAFGLAALDVGAEAALAPHAWVEAKIGERWIPLDPTFDQAPAGALRARFSTSDLNSFAGLDWNLGTPPEEGIRVIAAPLEIKGNRIVVDGLAISSSGGLWKLLNNNLYLEHPLFGQIAARGSIRALPASDAKRILVPGQRPARYSKSMAQLAIDCSEGRWLYFEGLGEAAAFEILRGISVDAVLRTQLQ